MEQKQTKNNWLDLTKKWYEIFTDVIDFVKAYKNIDNVMADINCQLKLSFRNSRGSFFDNISDLKNLISKENTEYFIIFNFYHSLLIINFITLTNKLALLKGFLDQFFLIF